MRFGVVGAGQMGGGIAQCALQTGYEVTLTDANEGAAQKAREKILAGLKKLASKGNLQGDPDAIVARLRLGKGLADYKDCDVVVEAAVEDTAVKQQIFRELDAAVKPGSILATNTSSISITKLGACTGRPELVCGMHFMNPAPLMTLVEVVPGLKTSITTSQKLEAMAKEMGKIVVYSKDYPGFLVNRILLPMINEAVWALYEGIGTVEDLDQAARLGLNHPMGPFALADLIGLDTCLSILTVLHNEFGNPKYHPCPLLVKHVEAGFLGKKTGRGFYDYGAK